MDYFLGKWRHVVPSRRIDALPCDAAKPAARAISARGPSERAVAASDGEPAAYTASWCAAVSGGMCERLSRLGRHVMEQ